MRYAPWLILMALTGCSSEADRETEFERLASPHGEYTLITTVIEPWVPHGPHYVVAYVSVGGTRTAVGRAELAYDGIPYTRRNIGMRWVSDDEALVCLRATDRPDHSFHVKVENGKPAARLEPGC